MLARHSVRRYAGRKIEPENAAAIQAEIDAIGRETGLDFRLVLDDPNVFRADRPRYGSFSGCRNFIVLYGPKGADEQVGDCGARAKALIGPCSKTGRGIVKYHFKLGAGRENFERV